MWRDLGKWIVDVGKAWIGWIGGSTISILMGIGQQIGLWPAISKSAYYAVISFGLLCSMFQAWRGEYRKKLEIERKHLDEQPRFSIRVGYQAAGWEAWEAAKTANEIMVQFIAEHYGGRVPERLRFDRTVSLAGKYYLAIKEIPFVKERAEYLVFEVWIRNTQPDLSDASMALYGKLGQGEMLNLFVWDGSPGLGPRTYPLTVRYEDRGEERTKQFEIEFNARRYEFNVKSA